MAQLRLVLVFVLWGSWACSSEPRAGGQTGDPGVSEFTSFDPDSPGGLGGGAVGGGDCASGLLPIGERGNLGDVKRRWLDDGHLLQLDPREGLAVLDVTGAAPRVIGRLPLPPSIGDLYVTGQRALIVRRNARPFESYWPNGYPRLDDEAELIVVDLSDPERPLRLSSTALAEGARLSHLVVSEGSTHLYVLSDGGAPGGCRGPMGHALLAAYELVDGELVQGASLELGPDVGSVGFAQDNLVVVRRARDMGSAPLRLSLVPLSKADGSLKEGDAVDLALGPIGLHAAGDTLRVVSSESLSLFDISDPHHPRGLAECALDAGEFFFARVSFTPHHTFVTDVGRSGENRVFSVAADDDGSCNVEDRAGHGRTLIALTESRVLDIEAGEDGLEVRLLDDADLAVLDAKVVALEAGLSEVGYNLGEDVLTLLAAPGAEQDGVFGIGLSGSSAGGEALSGLQLFSFSSSTLSARGALSPARPWAGAVGASAPLVQLPTGVARLDLGSLDAPRVSEGVGLFASYARAWALDDHWLRVRLPGEADSSYRDKYGLSNDALLSPRVPAHLEVVDAREGPASEKVIASLEVNPLASFVRVGNLVVSIVSSLERGPQPARMEVFDLEDPSHPRRRGALMVSDLWLRDKFGRGQLGGPNDPFDCLDCPGPDLAPRTLVVPGALVFRSPEEANPRTLRVLDLRDPDAPALHEPLDPPSSADMVSALTVGSSVYYAHRVRNEEPAEEGTWPRARFYFGRVDLSDPSAPVFAPEVNVPGQLVAIDGEHVYTREFFQRDGKLHTRVHRSLVRDGHAELRATHDFGDWLALSIATDGAGHLLADLQPPAWESPSEHDPPRGLVLHVLDADSLELVGKGDVGRFGTRLAARGDRVLYEASQGFLVMDLSDPAAPFARAWVPVFTLYSTRGQLTQDGALLHDGVGLIYLDGGFANLPR
jgi:hypothetical protein